MSLIQFHNYHRHSMYSNVRVNDVVVKNEDYVKRALELGHTTVFSTEHGNSGNIFELYDLCEEAGLKAVHGYESYFVYDRLEKTKRNWHMIIISLNRNGYRKNNLINSIANMDGFYRQPRIDIELLLSLPPDDVVVTSACINNPICFPDEDHDYEADYILPLKQHFGNHFLLEVQDHNDENQKRLNKEILRLSDKYNIPIIHGCDSHYILPEHQEDRKAYLDGKNFNYPIEDGFILDYPDSDTIFKRYEEQGVLSPQQVKSALEATLIFDKAEDLGFTKDIKMPTAYPDLTLDEREKKLKSLANKSFSNILSVNNITPQQRDIMIDGIKKELEVVHECNIKDVRIADYFLINELIIKEGLKMGGVITKSGRGSASSWYLNTLLGFSSVDRFASPIELFPSRFISSTRILETRSLPDIDFNVADDKPFIEASKKILGENSCYRMLAYGTQKESAAFRNYCRSLNLEPSSYNHVGKNIDDYRDDDKWKDVIATSDKFVGVIDSVAPSPCSHLLLDGDIREEIGLLRIGDELCANIDGYTADKWKFLKNDILIVKVWKIISETYKLLDKPIPTFTELYDLVDDKVWDLFKYGTTATINQCSTPHGQKLVKKYQPKSLAELALFVAMIRPGAASLLQTFLEREPYTTGVDEIDRLLTSSYHFMAYQESIMRILTFLGVPEDETYQLVKKISKKKFSEEDLNKLKEELQAGFSEKVGTHDGFQTVWQVMEDAARYSFNASHALCVAIDALYGAYLKANHPLEYYTVCLNLYEDDIEMTRRLTDELKSFNITLQSPKFRHSSGSYSVDKDKPLTITKGIGSIKNINPKIGDMLYEKRDEEIDGIYDLFTKTASWGLGKSQMTTLIYVNFFSEFGRPKGLLKCYELYREHGGKTNRKIGAFDEYTEQVFAKYAEKLTAKTYKNVDMEKALNELFKPIKNEEFTQKEQIEIDVELTGYLTSVFPERKGQYFCMECDTKYTPKVTLYSIGTGVTRQVKVKKKTFLAEPFDKGDVIIAGGFKKDKKWVKTESGFEQTDEDELFLWTYTVKEGA